MLEREKKNISGQSEKSCGTGHQWSRLNNTLIFGVREVSQIACL